MKLKRLFSLAVLVTASLLLIGTESRADSVTLPATLAAVNGNQPVVEGSDKTFDVLSATPAGTQPQSLSGIIVNPATAGTGGIPVPPFGFSLQGPIVFASNGGSSDLSLIYTVTSSGLPIAAVNLIGVGGVSGNGSSIRIDESIFAPDGSPIGFGSLVGPGSITIPLSGSFSTITVLKDILAVAGPDVGSSANYTIVTQTFTQVPEPASLALLGVGMIGIPALHRIQRKRKPLVV